MLPGMRYEFINVWRPICGPQRDAWALSPGDGLRMARYLSGLERRETPDAAQS